MLTATPSRCTSQQPQEQCTKCIAISRTSLHCLPAFLAHADTNTTVFLVHADIEAKHFDLPAVKGTHYATTQQIFPSCVKVLSFLDGFHGLGSDLQVLLLLVPSCFLAFALPFFLGSPGILLPCFYFFYIAQLPALLRIHKDLRPLQTGKPHTFIRLPSLSSHTLHLLLRPGLGCSTSRTKRRKKKKDRHVASLTALKAPRTPKLNTCVSL